MKSLSFVIVLGVLLASSLAGAGEAPGPEVEFGFNNGFYLQTSDGQFRLRLNGAVGFRYSYADYDNTVVGNEDDYSNFYMRRARIYLRGHAFDPRFTYLIHLQLEPHRTTNSHDIWLEYDFGDLLKIGVGRNKIAYGLEFLNSGLGGNLVERSVMYGMSDLDKGGGGPRYPGGGTEFFSLNAAAKNGFATGGMTLYRSQGIQLRGKKGSVDESTFEYQLGLWQGRGSMGLSNRSDDHLVALRLGYAPWGWVNWFLQGDGENSQRVKAGFFLSVYTNSSELGGGYAEHGANLAAIARWRGFSADVEIGSETFDYDLYEDDFERFGWRIQIGQFVRPKVFEIALRYAEIQRLKDPSSDRLLRSGLGLAEINTGQGTITGLEERISEFTVGGSYFINEWHRHKLQIDVSRLERQFVADESAGIPAAPDQIDYLMRIGLQLVF